MFKCLLTLFLLGSASCMPQADQAGGDLESIIAEIFKTPGNTPSSTTQSAIKPEIVPQNQEEKFPPAGPGFIVAPLFTDSQVLQAQASTIVPPASNNAATEDKSCKTTDNEDGSCVQYFLCDGNNTIIDDGVGIIDIRAQDGACPSYLDTCCLSPNIRPEDNPITPPPPPKEEEKIGCGWRNPDGVGFRIKGDQDSEAKFAEFPWMVAILKVEPVEEKELDGQYLNVYVGGGSLIHPSIVLTAAHYVSSSKNLRVRAGEWDTQTKSEIYPYQDRDVKETVTHKDFNSGNLFYDIALLFLAAPMDMAPNVNVACLPPPGERATAGARCFASGWGKDQFGKEGRYQVILKKVEVPVVDRSTCQKSLRKTRLGSHFVLHSSFMCAGGEAGKDTCRGDGGSPLVCPIEYEKDRYQQNGIVAWGIGCGENGTPGVYVDVANLRNWIDDKVAGHGFDPKVYKI